MTNSCRTCQHWDQDAMKDRWNNAYRMAQTVTETDEQYERRQVVTNAQYGECVEVPSNPAEEYRAAEPIALPLALTYDGSDYMSGLVTRGDFGCALWQQRTEEQA
jgi:hypothetical protein